MNDKFQHICKYMTGNEVIDRLDDHCGLINNSIHGQVLMDFVDWIELRRLAILGHAAETAPVVAWMDERGCTTSNASRVSLEHLKKYFSTELIIRPTSESKP